MADQITDTIESRARGEAKKNTIFNTLLDSNLPPYDISPNRLQQEAITVVGAGLETTMRALSVATYHLLSNPAMKRRLFDELIGVIPDPATRGADMPKWDSLAKLPYLTAVIYEALRLSYGTMQRMPRKFPKTTLQYKDFTIPAGVTVSMDIYSISHDENIFPDSFAFIPERWMGNPKAPDGKQLSRYLASFSGGTRNCVGMQLAYAELYIGLASMFRRFDFELFETGRGDIDALRDCFVPRPKLGSNGVQAFCFTMHHA